MKAFKKALMGNCYPRSFISSASVARAFREDDVEREEDRPPIIVYFPYIAGVSERIRRTSTFRVVFSPTLRSLLTKVKDLFLWRSKQTSSTKYHAPTPKDKSALAEHA